MGAAPDHPTWTRTRCSYALTLHTQPQYSTSLMRLSSVPPTAFSNPALSIDMVWSVPSLAARMPAYLASCLSSARSPKHAHSPSSASSLRSPDLSLWKTCLGVAAWGGGEGEICAGDGSRWDA